MRLLLTAMLFATLCLAQNKEQELKIPPIQSSVDLNGQSIGITIWGTVAAVGTGPLAVALTIDLGGFQDHLTPILAAQLNRSDRCGEQITVEHATLAPAAPSSMLTTNVNYERYACAKAFGKEIVKKLAGGHATIVIKLTPQVDDNNISLDSEIVKLDADGSLGQLLHSDSLGDSLRQDIGDSIESAVQTSADLNKALPAALANAITIQSLRFADSQSDRHGDGAKGRLWLLIAAQARLSPEELRRAVGK